MFFSTRSRIKSESNKYTLDPYVSSLGAWALSLGTSIGWGSLVVTSNTYLLKSGPGGSVLGMIIGAVIMLIISRNYHYMMNCFPDSGGAYTFSKEAFGFDHGFLTAWFLGLTYIAVLWANATSLPLFLRYFLGSTFQFGFRYDIWGYEVYLGEALLSIAAIFLIAYLCIRYKHLTMKVMIITVMIFVVGITVCFLEAMILRDGKIHSFEPGYIPDKDVMMQIIRIACISPWAFIGFENISNLSEEFKFPHKKAFKVLAISVITTTALYIFVTLLSVTAYPTNYASWLDYIKDLDNISGYKGLPAFYAAHHYLGNTGVSIMMMTLLALILSSLIGNITALSRLLYALAKDAIIPRRFKLVNKWGAPAKAILLIAVISIPIPFLGRTAISWIVDVTTIGATIIYALVSASCYKVAKNQNRAIEKWNGILGVVLMIGFGLYLLIPNLLSAGDMAEEAFMLFTGWGVLGFIYFRVILMKDQQWRFGKTIIVWVGLLALILFIALIGMNQQMISDTDKAMFTIHEHYTSHGTVPSHLKEDEKFISGQMQFLRVQNLKSSLLVFGLFLFAIITMLANYSLMRKRAEESNEELGIAKRIAFTDPLTGVKSGHAFVDDGKEIDRRILNKEMTDFAIVICDINDLKHINDSMGHATGDEYIKAGCNMICDYFVHSPVYRIGGDEFLVLLIGRDYVNRYSLLERMNSRTEDNLIHDKVVLASGMAEFDPEIDDNILSVMERADEIMYNRKRELKERKK